MLPIRQYSFDIEAPAMGVGFGEKTEESSPTVEEPVNSKLDPDNLRPNLVFPIHQQINMPMQ